MDGVGTFYANNHQKMAQDRIVVKKCFHTVRLRLTPLQRGIAEIQFRWDNIVIEKPCALSGHEVVGS